MGNTRNKKSKFVLWLVITAIVSAILGGLGRYGQTTLQGGGDLWEDEIGEKINATYQIHVYVDDNWGNPNIWAWSETLGNAAEQWPGYQMKKDGANSYIWTLSSLFNNVVISDEDGIFQTEDIIMAGKDVWFFIDGIQCYVTYDENVAVQKMRASSSIYSD